MSRPRGFIDSWKPYKKTRVKLDAIDEILLEYNANLPLTIRQVFYRLVIKSVIGKTENEYDNLCGLLNTARRARRISMDVIRDDGFVGGFSVYKDYWEIDELYKEFSLSANAYKRDRQQEQDNILVVFCEAAGMVPQLEKVADDYSVPVKSSGGFDGTTIKHTIGRDWGKSRPVTILHIGDYDPSGECMFDALSEDVTAFADYYGNRIEFVRIAVTPEQVEKYNLPTELPKKSSHQDKKQMTETVQAEALDPTVLAHVLRCEIESRLDMSNFQPVVILEAEERSRIISTMRSAGIYKEVAA